MQKNIDFGTFPDDPSADPIRSAFQKTQQNFTELFQNQVTSGVSSVNKTPGMGITVNSPTGDVIISANIACVKVFSTSMTLSLLNSTPTSFVTLTQSSSQTLQIELPSNITTLTTGVTNISLSGNITASELTTTGIVSATGNIQGSNLITSGVLSAVGNANIGNIGTSGLITAIGNIQGGNLITTGSLVVEGNVNLGDVSNVIITGGLDGQFLTTDGNGALSWTTSEGANGTAIINGNSSVIVEIDGNVNTSINGVANVLQVTEDSVIIANGTGGSLLGANSITANFFFGTIRTAIQTNITSLGNLDDLAVDGISVLGNLATGATRSRMIEENDIFYMQAGNGVVGSGSPISFAKYSSTTSTMYLDIANQRVGMGGNIDPAHTLSITGTLNVSDEATFANLVTFSSEAGISANGGTQSTATVLTKTINQVTTVSSGQGVRLPVISQGFIVYVTNDSANSLLVYPASSAQINSLSADTALTMTAGTTLQFIAGSSTKWYTVGAI